MRHMLIVDDHPEQAQELIVGLERNLGPGWTYEVVSTVPDAERRFAEATTPWDVVVMDLILREEHRNEQMKDDIENMDGIILSRSLLRRFSEQPIILVTASIILAPDFMESLQTNGIFRGVITKTRMDGVESSGGANLYEDRLASTVGEIVGISK